MQCDTLACSLFNTEIVYATMQTQEIYECKTDMFNYVTSICKASVSICPETPLYTWKTYSAMKVYRDDVFVISLPIAPVTR